MLRQIRGFLQLLSLIIVLSSIGGNDACTTPKNKNGACIVITECEELNGLLYKRFRTADETEYMSKSQCGQEGRHPKVCCEIKLPQGPSCLTPDNLQGRCIDIYKCPTLEPLLNLPKPLPQDIVTYLKSSFCVGAVKYSACCSDKQPSVTQPRPTQPLVGQPPVNVDLENSPFPECGVDRLTPGSDRVIDGKEVHIWQYPWTGIIEYQNSYGDILQSCGGSLIAKRYLVTAARCVTGAILRVSTPLRVIFGEFDTSNPTPECTVIDEVGTKACMDKPVVIPIERSIPHPDYTWRGRKNDIALIRLAREAPYTDFIRPICLPSSDITAGLKTGDMNLTVTGWGTTEEGHASAKKRHLNMPFSELNDCQISYNWPIEGVVLWDKQVCAGGQPDQDSCLAGNGSPLMRIDSSGNHTLIGVGSFCHLPCESAGVPVVYTNVFAYLDWIKQQMMK